jgi:HEAT repeat protein
MGFMRGHSAGFSHRLTIITAGLALLALALWALSTPPVPTQGGRTAREWLVDLAGPNHEQQKPALEAFGAMGEAAIPVLATSLNEQNSAIEQLMLRLKTRVPQMGLWVIHASDRQTAALDALERIGTVATLPALIRFLETAPNRSASDEARRAKASTIIGGLGIEARAALPVLLDIVRADAGRGSDSGRAALAAVIEIGGHREHGAPVLIECLRSGDERLRRLAAGGIGDWGPEAAFAVEPLRAALWNPDAGAFTEVAAALGQVGAAAHEAAPDLVRGLKHESSMIRAVAALNLARVKPAPELAVPALVEALKDEDTFVRSRAAWALGTFGAGAAWAAEDLGRALHDESEAVQISVIQALGAIGPGAAGIVPDLERARSNRQAGLGRYVVAALARIEHDGNASGQR